MPTQIDTLLLEKQQAFDRSKLAERIVHPCGSSAFGSFQVTKDISHLTKADFLQPGKKTPCYTRFSTVTYGVSVPQSCVRCILADFVGSESSRIRAETHEASRPSSTPRMATTISSVSAGLYSLSEIP